MKYLTSEEWCHSETDDKYGIGNHPTKDIETNIIDLVNNVLDPLREAIGAPITVNSGYRSPILNMKVGGASTSQHTKGEAADITRGSRAQNKNLFSWLKENCDFDQLIWEFGDASGPDWVHVSYRRGNNRKQVLKSKNAKGKTIYENVR